MARERLRVAHAWQKAGGPTAVANRAAGQQRQIHDPRPRRARLRRAEDRMVLFVRTVGLPRARTKIGLANWRTSSMTSNGWSSWSGRLRAAL